MAGASACAEQVGGAFVLQRGPRSRSDVARASLGQLLGRRGPGSCNGQQKDELPALLVDCIAGLAGVVSSAAPSMPHAALSGASYGPGPAWILDAASPCTGSCQWLNLLLTVQASLPMTQAGSVGLRGTGGASHSTSSQ
jgi:hypothetical protein